MMSSDDVVKAHAVGTELEDVKVTFLHDVTIKVGDIDVTGKQGEILNLPRWVADTLESEHHVQIQETDMLVELKQSSTKESGAGEYNLAKLDEHFYIKVKSYMKKLPEKDFDKMESMLLSLVRIRRGKIIRMANSDKLNSSISSKLTIEEQQLYNKVYTSGIDFTQQILGDKK